MIPIDAGPSCKQLLEVAVERFGLTLLKIVEYIVMACISNPFEKLNYLSIVHLESNKKMIKHRDSTYSTRRSRELVCLLQLMK